MSAELKTAYDAKQRATDHEAAILKRDYPVGDRISWHWAGRKHFGSVIRHSYGDRILVENDETRKQRWISVYNIIGDT